MPPVASLGLRADAVNEGTIRTLEGLRTLPTPLGREPAAWCCVSLPDQAEAPRGRPRKTGGQPQKFLRGPLVAVWTTATSRRSHKRLLSHRWAVQTGLSRGWGRRRECPESSACLHNCLSVGTGLALGTASARPGMGQPGDSKCSNRTPLRPSLLCRPSQGANRNPDRQPVADSGHTHG
jgi:hypothetical protein